MSDSSASSFSFNSRSRWPLVVIICCCLIMIAWLKVEGVLLAAVVLAMTYVVTLYRPAMSETSSLETSIRLSAGDIADVIEAYDQFLSDPTETYLADRTLYRPALADPDCADPAIETFFFQYQTAKKFVGRIEHRLAATPSTSELETLLSVTDQRALELEQAWLEARRAAQRLGTDYKQLP